MEKWAPALTAPSDPITPEQEHEELVKNYREIDYQPEFDCQFKLSGQRPE